MIENIKIQGYKSIKDIEIDLKSINMLIGSNGSGKSNLLSFFEFLDHLYNQKLQEYVGLKGGISKILFNGKGAVDTLFAAITFNNNINGYNFKIKRSANNFVFAEEIFWFNGIPWVENNYSQESVLKNSELGRKPYIKNYINTLKKYHFHDTGTHSPFNQSSKIGKDNLYLYSKGQNLAAFLYHLKKEYNKNYNMIINIIQSVVPYFSDFILNPDEKNNIVLYWQSKHSEYNYDITDLSDGSLRFIALSVLFMQPNPPNVIIIDEPELGLHPFAIAKLAGMIQSVASKNVQVIVATQSADLINYFNAEDIITVDNKNGESIFTRLDEKELTQWLEEYNIGDLWQKNIIHKGQPI